MLKNLSEIAVSLSSQEIGSGVSLTKESKGTQTTTKVKTEPGQKTTKADGSPKDTFELSQDAQNIRQLQRRDAEVRSHEAAHAAAGGQYAGSPRFSYSKGADGRTYATAGEVSIDVAAVPGDPEATLQKANQVKAAALAPASPSSQDMKVAQKAQMMATKARQQMDEEQLPEANRSDSNGDTDIKGPAESSQIEDGPPTAMLEDSAYQAYANSVPEFISVSIYS